MIHIERPGGDVFRFTAPQLTRGPRLYWDRIRSKYALCQQQPPILLPSQTMEPFSQAADETFPLPRFWFHNNTHPPLIQQRM